jgi:hypothetical protein
MDVYLTLDTRPCPSIEAGEGSLWEQIKTNAWDTILARALCNCYGQLYIEIDPQLVTDRSGFPVVIDVLKEDCEKDMTDIGREPTARTGRLSASGVEYTWGNNGEGIARLAFSPGHVFKQHGIPDSLEKLLVSSQSQLNDIAGLYIARANNPYPDVKTVLTQNNRFIDICPRQFFHMTRDAADNPRAIDFDYDILPTRVARPFDRKTGFMSCEISGEAAVLTDLSITGTIPLPAPPDVPPAEGGYPVISFPPFVPYPFPGPSYSYDAAYIDWDLSLGDYTFATFGSSILINTSDIYFLILKTGHYLCDFHFINSVSANANIMAIEILNALLFNSVASWPGSPLLAIAGTPAVFTSSGNYSSFHLASSITQILRLTAGQVLDIRQDKIPWGGVPVSTPFSQRRSLVRLG